MENLVPRMRTPCKANHHTRRRANETRFRAHISELRTELLQRGQVVETLHSRLDESQRQLETSRFLRQQDQETINALRDEVDEIKARVGLVMLGHQQHLGVQMMMKNIS